MAASETARRIRPGIAGMAALILTAAAAVWLARAHDADVGWVEHSFAVRNAIGAATMHWQYLQDIGSRAAPLQMEDSLTELRRLTRDNPRQQAQLERIAALLRHDLTEAAEVRALFEAMRREEIELNQLRQLRARDSLRALYAAVSLGVLVAFACFLADARAQARRLAAAAATVAELRVARAEGAALVETSADAVWAVDRGMRVTGCNQRFRKLLHDSADFEHVASFDGRELSFAEHAVWRAYYQKILSGERMTIEMMQHIRGHERWFLVVFGPIVVDGAVVGAAASAKDITVRKRAELKLQRRAEDLHYLSILDETTQLYNRRGFLELGGLVLRDARAQCQPVALFFVDVDGLERIGDRQGLAARDATLERAARLVQECVRKTDVVARLGGGLVILAAGLDDESIVIDRIGKRAGAERLRLSIGVIKEEPGAGGRTLEELVDGADAILYEHKAARKRTHLRLVPKLEAGGD